MGSLDYIFSPSTLRPEDRGLHNQVTDKFGSQQLYTMDKKYSTHVTVDQSGTRAIQMVGDNHQKYVKIHSCQTSSPGYVPTVSGESTIAQLRMQYKSHITTQDEQPLPPLRRS